VFADEDTKYFEGDMPAEFSGYWQRDYASSDNITQVLLPVRTREDAL
jgi:hypothetical protein